MASTKTSLRRRRKQEDQAMTANGMMTPAMCAADIGVTDQTIYNWLAAGLLVAKRIGPRTVRILRETWEEFKAAAPTYTPEKKDKKATAKKIAPAA